MKKIKIPSKEDVINYYIIGKHTKDETCVFFNVSPSTLSRWFKLFNIQKTKEEMIETKCRKQEDYSYQHGIQLKREQTCLTKYGVKNVLQSADVKKKVRATCLNKYGTRAASQSQQVKDKIANTNLQKYGTTCVFANVKVQQKIKDTFLQKYGTIHPTQSTVVKEKTKNTNLKKYGVPFFQQHFHDCSVDSINILNNKESLQEFLLNLKEKRTMHEISFLLKCDYQRVQKSIKEFELQDLISIWPGYSYKEKELQDFIRTECTSNIICNSREILDNKEIDIYCPDQKIGIEFNGIYWHSIKVLSEKGHDKNYHFDKSKLAQEKGIRLIHIYEYEWDDPIKQQIIKSMLKIAFNKMDSKIYARKCEIHEITNKDARDFNNTNHLQGHRNAQLTLGLYYKDRLVQLMSFSKSRYNKNLKQDNSWEIIRGCPGSNNIVIGGVSKLFNYFIKHYNPQQVFSYCDFNKFNGISYEAIGMKFIGYTGPDMKWILSNGIVIDRCPSKHKELKDSAVSQIFGSGSKKYLWEKNNN